MYCCAVDTVELPTAALTVKIFELGDNLFGNLAHIELKIFEYVTLEPPVCPLRPDFGLAVKIGCKHDICLNRRTGRGDSVFEDRTDEVGVLGQERLDVVISSLNGN